MTGSIVIEVSRLDGQRHVASRRGTQSDRACHRIVKNWKIDDARARARNRPTNPSGLESCRRFTKSADYSNRVNYRSVYPCHSRVEWHCLPKMFTSTTDRVEKGGGKGQRSPLSKKVTGRKKATNETKSREPIGRYTRLPISRRQIPFARD